MNNLTEENKGCAIDVEMKGNERTRKKELCFGAKMDEAATGVVNGPKGECRLWNRHLG